MRPIAIYLPQYHPIPENDQWWGTGFTEWTSVKKARPLFKGHYQPHIPKDLGYYDLRLPGTMERQVDLANAYGIKGFLFYHYWFEGKRLLNLPIDNYRFKIQNKVPYFLCWTNETWYNNWYQGDGKQTLIEQAYSKEDDLKHIQFLLDYFRDDDYIKVDGKPVLVVYRTDQLPHPNQTAEVWNEVLIRNGFKGIYLIRVENVDKNLSPASIGFDAAMEFHPTKADLEAFRVPQGWWQSLLFLIEKNAFSRRVFKSIVGNAPISGLNKMIDYKQYAESFSAFKDKGYKRYPCVMPAFDNSPRRVDGKSTIFYNASPELYYQWLRRVLMSFKPYSTEEDFVFVNAWNEWGEGNHLEPCNRWGHQYLEFTKLGLDEYENGAGRGHLKNESVR